jgi:ABC-2 type transport system ATP-binding protein
VTIFLTTHNLSEAEKLCQQLGVIRQGKLLASGSPDELRRAGDKPRLEISGKGFDEDVVRAIKLQPQVAAVFFVEQRLVIEFNEPCSSAPFVSLLVNAGATIEEVHKGKVDLEEAFLSLLDDAE